MDDDADDAPNRKRPKLSQDDDASAPASDDLELKRLLLNAGAISAEQIAAVDDLPQTIEREQWVPPGFPEDARFCRLNVLPSGMTMP